MPFWNRTVFAWLPSARPSALTSSPDFLRSSSSLCMNWIIPTIHSLPMVASPASADPNVMIMYFTDSLLWKTALFGAFRRRSHYSVGAGVPSSTSCCARAAAGPRCRHASVPGSGIRELIHTWHRLWALPGEGPSFQPLRVVDGLGERLAAAVLLQLQVEA